MPVILTFDPGSRLSSWGLIESLVNGQEVALTFLAKGECDSTEAGFRQVFARVQVAPDVTGIESITPEGDATSGYAFAPTANRGGGQSVVRALMLTNKATGPLVMIARQHTRVIEMTAAKARGLVVRNQHARDPLVKKGVERYVAGLPRQTSNHVRDALLLGVAVAWRLAGERRPV